MDRDQQFLTTAGEVIGEIAEVLKAHEEQARRRDFPSVPPMKDISPQLREAMKAPRHLDGRPMREDEIASSSEKTLAAIERVLLADATCAHNAIEAAYRLGVLDGLLQMAKVGAK